MAIVTSLIPLKVYNNIHIQSVYSVIRCKLYLKLQALSCNFKHRMEKSSDETESIVIFTAEIDLL